MIWLIAFVLFFTASLWYRTFLKKREYYKKNGYWEVDLQAGKYGAIIYAFLYFIVGVFALIRGLLDCLK